MVHRDNRDENWKIEIIRSQRKTMSVQVCYDLHIQVRAPKRVTDAQVRKMVENNAGWIAKQMSYMVERRKEEAEDPTPELTAGRLKELTREAGKVLPKKVEHYAPLVGVSYGRISYGKQRTRWGSCSSTGNLRFNCLLMLTPDYVQDYVVVHELCHRLQMNHSDRFWLEVERVLPDYRQGKTWLDRNGIRMIRKLTELEAGQKKQGTGKDTVHYIKRYGNQ